MLKISEKSNPNYLAKVVRIDNLRKHSNADKLQITTIDFQNVITGLDCKEGDIYVYFPLECAINKEFLSWSNSFQDKELNVDKTQAGFFNKHGRVRAVKLRGELSQGYIIPATVLEEWLRVVLNKDTTVAGYNTDNVGKEFDSYEDIIICKKYIPNGRTQGSGNNKQQGKSPRISRLVEGQFLLHNDTENLRKNIHKLELSDIIGIHYKKHGTSFVVGNVLTKKKLSWKDKVAKFFGIKVVEKNYDIIYSSRNVVKNQYETANVGHYYDVDIWGIVKEELKSKIPKGYTLYGEILGYLPSGKMIQKDYDYGCKEGEHKTYIYKISFTNEDGVVSYLTDKQIEEFCENRGLLYKNTLIYYGSVYDYIGGNYLLANTEDWREVFIKHLEEKYNEKDCYMCTNKVPEEGVVLRIEHLDRYEAYKLKSARFLEHETKVLDSEEANIEDELPESSLLETM